MKKINGESNKMYLEMVTLAFSYVKIKPVMNATNGLTPEALNVKYNSTTVPTPKTAGNTRIQKYGVVSG